MPRDDRTYITVHDGMPEHPKVEGLSDAAFRLLIKSMFLSRDGYIDVGSLPAKTRGEFWDAGIMSAAGLLYIHNDLFRGPYRERDNRDHLPTEIRKAVYERDGYRCVTCSADRPLSLDHIYPWSLGGGDELENLQTLCVPCNCRKGARI
jgi:HNH endonuclease